MQIFGDPIGAHPGRVSLLDYALQKLRKAAKPCLQSPFLYVIYAASNEGNKTKLTIYLTIQTPTPYHQNHVSLYALENYLKGGANLNPVSSSPPRRFSKNLETTTVCKFL